MTEYTPKQMAEELAEFIDYAESIVPDPLPKLRAVLSHLVSEPERIAAAVEAEFEKCCKAVCHTCTFGETLRPSRTKSPASDDSYWKHPNGMVCGATSIRERRYQEQLKQPEIPAKEKTDDTV